MTFKNIFETIDSPPSLGASKTASSQERDHSSRSQKISKRHPHPPILTSVCEDSRTSPHCSHHPTVLTHFGGGIHKIRSR
ncbi:hypothetical protein JTE90_028836 [Oedothorax gibbosus]|uniref:Uncharacterized protein n=1 Tax=Oedothorax gibbosus TaxID=931172 RepID=A0AAV6VZW7_9ARAC|nr:hypothetical protein JTE90_028836 [Oedothorax gibbosus]